MNTVKTILSCSELKRIFSKLRQVYLLLKAAPEFDLNVIVFIPKDALLKVTKLIAEKNISTIQAYAEDLEMSLEHKFIIVIKGDIPLELFKERIEKFT
ncbi:hypothetical protein DRN86_05820 [Candidatus Geothermarchaeota archaeon]|mgnify:CR=1 FL=1|nr:MAG: hypothetical protein DRN86_05820 [Candidatus Geothermarchaeota archaeon]